MNLDSMRVNIFKELMTLDKIICKVICLYINFNKKEGNCRGDFVGGDVGG